MLKVNKGLRYLLILLALSLFLVGCGSSQKALSVQSGPTDPNYRGVIYQDNLKGPDSGKPNI
ncbi:hypothetical protein MCACP_19430 [Neomoorella carbonis]